ncbi:MAG: DUF6701 domain-containing protein, partial [Vibrio sp.]
ARPWTLAICSPSGHEMNGDIIDQESVGFAAAGAAFDLHLRPLRWVSNSGDKSDPLTGGNAIETSEYCNSPITQNFFSGMASLETKVQLTHQVAQPEGGYDGELKGTLEQLNTAGKENVPFNGLSWSEVGVLRVNADIDGTYLGMKVNQGYRNIGRFYPAWLKIISNDWDYATDHNNFVYMDQAIPYSFVVEAQNTGGEPTRNYSQFAHELIADVKLLAVDSDGEDLGARIKDDAAQFWDGSDQDEVKWSGARLAVTKDFIFKKDRVSDAPYTTAVDGPYQNGFGLRVLDKVDSKIKVDGVDFIDPDLDLKASGTLIDTGKSFATQPDIRYGRMVMDDVGGTSVSKIAIPLRVEYWQGSRFTTNHADSGSVYATLDNYICKQTLWPSPSSPSNAKLSGSDTEPWTKVSQGQSKQLVAEPHATEDTQGLREQIRFWLRLDNDQTNLEDNKRSPQVGEEGVNCGTQYTSQPWLQYNWFARGDEDPSAVVTFGIHRGNDKIIFRGETRLSGQ